jgi:hypothetical protein
MKNENIDMNFINELERKLRMSGTPDIIKKETPQFKTGDFAPDGSIYLGYYNNKDWFVAAQDAKNAKGKNIRMTFNKAAEYAKKLKAHGQNDWMVPPSNDSNPHDEDILNALFNNKNNGAFDGTYSEDIYWSSTQNPNSFKGDAGYAREQSFLDGGRHWNRSDISTASHYILSRIAPEYSVRPVRAVPRPK